jgi:hypothetical protein
VVSYAVVASRRVRQRDPVRPRVVAVRALTWNMNHRPSAWQWLFDNRDAFAVALVQEASRPPTLPDGVTVYPAGDASEWRIQSPIDATARSWRSAVAVLDPTLVVDDLSGAPIQAAKTGQVVASNPGQWAAVRLRSIGPADLVLVSMYGLWDDIPAHGLRTYAVPSVHRAISDITPFIWGSRKRVIVAGDMNIYRGYGDWAKGYNTVFDRFRAEGLECRGPFGDAPLSDCPCGPTSECRHIATLRSRGMEHLQTDFVFSSRPLAKVTAHVVPDSWRFSDHCAVEISVPI